jgi:hypothetical protein
MNSNILFRFSATLVIAVSLLSCEENVDPILDFQAYRSDLYGSAPTFTPMGVPKQKVLLEDFTGHECGNCPNGHVKAAQLLATYGVDLAVVAIHAGSLAAPLAPDYPTDWTTEEGTYYLLTQVGQDIMPKGRINRRENAATIFSPSAWPAQVTAAFTAQPAANLQLQASYEASGGQWNVHAFAEWLENAEGDYRLVVMLTESGIEAPQLWYNNNPEYIAGYHHEHMLRTTGTGATGLKVFSNPIEGMTKRFSYTFDWNSEWVPENCEVIALLTEGENGRVVNVAKVKLVP